MDTVCAAYIINRESASYIDNSTALVLTLPPSARCIHFAVHSYYKTCGALNRNHMCFLVRTAATRA